MAIDFNYPQNLMQYKSYIIAKQNQYEFFFPFKSIDMKEHTIRIFKNELILDEKEYGIEIVIDKGINVIMNTPCNENDRIHIGVFMPLERFNAYSVCIAAERHIPCVANLSTYPLDYEYYSEVTCKLQVIHSRLGFIPKDMYSIIGNKIKFTGVKFLSNEYLYIKIIQDGGILLQ